MSLSYFYLELDTTAPANPSIIIENGSQFANQQLVEIAIDCTDEDTYGYQMKIWGDVDESYDSDIQSKEETSNWITYQTSKQIKLSSGAGEKVLFLRIRDDVWNVSAQASDSIILDTSIPVVTITDPDVKKISTVAGKDTVNFSFQCNEDFVAYTVRVVNSLGATHDTGQQIPTTNGSVNMSGTGDFPSGIPIHCSIKGKDLQSASSGDGKKIIKVFVQDKSGLWSV